MPELVAEALQEDSRPLIDIDFPAEDKFDHLPEAAPQGVSAFLTIQEGCDRFCTFASFPTRGSEQSRPVEAVLAEARRLVAAAAANNVIGQMNAYHGVGPDGRDGVSGGLFVQ